MTIKESTQQEEFKFLISSQIFRLSFYSFKTKIILDFSFKDEDYES